METKIKISVIVPVFNGATSVETSLRTLFAQDLEAFEVVVVNDGSTDETAEVLDALAQEQRNLRVVHLDANGGVHEARAAGLRVARGEWIGFMDADDTVEPSMYATLHREAVDSNADIVICAVCIVDDSDAVVGTKVVFPRKDVFTENLLGRYCDYQFGTGALWNKLYRRALILRWGCLSFDWRQNATEDTLVNVGCFHDAKRVVVLPEVLYHYKIHAASATQSASAALNYTRLLRAYAEAVHVYADFDEPALCLIDQLYRTQLQGQTYAVSEAASLRECHDQLSEAVARLASLRPSTVYEAINPGIADPRFFLRRESTLRQWCRLSRALILGCARRLKLIKS